MITLEHYLMGRDLKDPVSEKQLRNASDLLCRVNWLMGWLNMTRRVTSGYRPLSINAKAGGAVRSTHLECQGIDIEDRDRELTKKIIANKSIIDDLDLYMEHPDYTLTWVHLDTRKRKNRIFIP